MSDDRKVYVLFFGEIVGFVLLVAWVVGAVFASGFWSTLLAAVFPPWAWYLVCEFVLHYFEFI